MLRTRQDSFKGIAGSFRPSLLNISKDETRTGFCESARVPLTRGKQFVQAYFPYDSKCQIGTFEAPEYQKNK